MGFEDALSGARKRQEEAESALEARIERQRAEEAERVSVRQQQLLPIVAEFATAAHRVGIPRYRFATYKEWVAREAGYAPAEPEDWFKKMQRPWDYWIPEQRAGAVVDELGDGWAIPDVRKGAYFSESGAIDGLIVFVDGRVHEFDGPAYAPHPATTYPWLEQLRDDTTMEYWYWRHLDFKPRPGSWTLDQLQEILVLAILNAERGRIWQVGDRISESWFID
ncbi:hypothetical protein [Agromyces mariniharenae]|uniref:Uncharacterized protein n=1 Tax=Agromyces mariniharenae TaxID=2604423 RepID=A0A5S4UZA3_9MICO|nr:hypothetical protein [Agromyces mariniharenae]TYL50441.1 hypothetical protein FYC51_14635 [Agromyces mariniharenae]